jgi:hypothetical protein
LSACVNDNGFISGLQPGSDITEITFNEGVVLFVQGFADGRKADP